MDPGLDVLVSRILREGAGRIRIRKTVYHPRSPVPKRARTYDDALKYYDASQKVWVGGLNDGVTWQNLQEIADTVGTSKWVEMLGPGQACVCYGTAEEAQTAIATLNGRGLHVDVWHTKDKA